MHVSRWYGDCGRIVAQGIARRRSLGRLTDSNLKTARQDLRAQIDRERIACVMKGSGRRRTDRGELGALAAETERKRSPFPPAEGTSSAVTTLPSRTS